MCRKAVFLFALTLINDKARTYNNREKSDETNTFDCTFLILILEGVFILNENSHFGFLE